MRIAILGNSGSGKSTLARAVAQRMDAACLDLDTVAWEAGDAPVLRDAAQARAEVEHFCASHARWMVEGCYASLIAAALPFDARLVLLDPGLEACLAHCRARPWEPHKFASRQEQDAHLPALLDWVRDYYRRDGDLSQRAHRALFEGFAGPKQVLTHLPPAGVLPPELAAWLA